MRRGGYTARLAAQHLLRGASAPRRAVREADAAGLGEAGRCLLVTVSAIMVVLADPGEDNVLRALMEMASEATTTGEAVYGLGFRLGIAVVVIVATYVVVAFLLWLATRLASASPSNAAARSSLAIGSWVSTLPLIVVGFVLHLLGQDTVIPIVLIALGVAFIALCLSETTGIDVRAAMGLTMGSFVVGGFSVVAMLFMLDGWYASLSTDQSVTISTRIVK